MEMMEQQRESEARRRKGSEDMHMAVSVAARLPIDSVIVAQKLQTDYHTIRDLYRCEARGGVGAGSKYSVASGWEQQEPVNMETAATTV